MTAKEFVKSVYPAARVCVDTSESSDPLDLPCIILTGQQCLSPWAATEKLAWNKAKKIIELKLISRLNN
jgi:hypothetical protein